MHTVIVGAVLVGLTTAASLRAALSASRTPECCAPNSPTS